jgi:spore coat polysaccharide biosynthesis protein SpsF (cytidylyltransferase family)
MSQNIVAIVQARMGSSRLPNKVMHKIADRPMIDFLLERLSYSKHINRIVLATSTNKENDPLARFVQKQNYAVFRGDEENVLQRFYDTSVLYSADHIVRITGDSPLIDPKICDELIDSYFANNADYAYLSEEFCEGVDCEIFSFKALLKAQNNAKLASELEHVTLYFHNHPNDFEITTLDNATNDSHYRFTVDNIEDAILVTSIINQHLKGIGQLTTDDIKKYLDNNPNLKAINNHIIRNEGLLKSLHADTIKKELFDE